MTLPTTLTLETPRCLLRIVDAADIPFVFDASLHPGFCDRMAWSPPVNNAELEAPLKRNLDAWTAGEIYTFTIFLKPCNERVGRIAIRRGENGCWNIGYWTHPAHQGRGIMTEVAAEIVRFGFQQLGARAIEAKHVVDNRSSRRVLEEIGLRFVEHLPHGFQKNGIWLAEDRLTLTREDFDALPPSPPTTSARLFYQPLEPQHAAELQEALCDPRVYEFISSGAPRDREELERQFTRMAAGAPAHRPDEEWWNFTVRRLDSSEAIGRLEATLTGPRAEIAYVFGPAHWGNGYGTEALQWLHDRLAEIPHITGFWATIHPDNQRSHRLLERNGYQEAFAGNWPDLSSYDSGDRVFRRAVLR